jgi:hypothetical protein
VNQHGLVGRQRAHRHEQLPGGEIVHRNCGALLVRKRRGFLEHLPLGHHDDVGIAAEACQSKNLLAQPVLARARTDGVDGSGDFIADDARDFWCIRIQALASEDVGEIDSACAHPDANFILSGCGIG